MKDDIKEKADYCLDCKGKPCYQACPLGNDTAGFIKLIKKDKLKEAYELLCKTTVLPAICGRICPQDKQCQGKCVRGIKGNQVAIGDMEAYIGDLAIKNNWKIPKENKAIDKKVAIIGGGPSGLTCAAKLAKEGLKVTIYEKHSKLGGILSYGIPDFRLDRKVIDASIQKILDLDIEIKCNQILGKDYSIEDLEKEYSAIYLSFGANISSKIGILGEELLGVYGGNELLENNIHPEYKDKTVVINGGGNVAIDVSRVIKSLGAKKVIISYRRSEIEMPAEKKEIEIAKKEGVEFLLQNNILRIIGKEKVEQIECIKTELVKKEGENRKVPINIPNSNYYIDTDYVIMAIGAVPEKELVSKLGINLNKKGQIQIDDKNMTSKQGIFAGGDLVGEKSTVAWASRSGRNAAENIIEYLK